MALFAIGDVRLSAVAAALPANEVRNRDVLKLTEPAARAFDRAVGIGNRRVALPTQCASDLCVAAAQQLLERLQLPAAEVGILVFVTQTPDYLMPGNSMLVQQRLGLSAATYLLDVHQGCAGYVYGLASLAALMAGAHVQKGLLLVGDTITRLLSPHDRSTVPIFSDAGSATVLEWSPGAPAMYFNLGSQGRGADAIQVGSGGARRPFGADSLSMTEVEPDVVRAPVHLAMRGVDVLHYSLTYVAANIRELLDFAQAEAAAPDYYVFHQANRILNDSLVKQLKLPAERVPETLAEYGNTSCASIPVTICKRLGGVLTQGSKRLLLSGFGAGFSWGGALIAADGVLCPPVIEMH